MMDDADIDELEELTICPLCIQDSFLQGEIRKSDVSGACSFCTSEGPVWSLQNLADEVGAVIRDHYRITDNDPSHQFDNEYICPDGHPIVNVIADLLGISEERAEQLRVILERANEDYEYQLNGDVWPFAEDAWYEETAIDTWGWHQGWRRFEALLDTETRFFSREAVSILENIFEDIHCSKSRNGDPIIQTFPTADIPAFYRARAFQSTDDLEEAMKRPDLHLGPPPHRLAQAGRMNARGISVFYGATDPNMAVSEVRPPVGSHVLVGRFEINRSLNLLNLMALEKLEFLKGSLFDPEHIKRLERGSFLETLSTLLSRPVMPNDEPFMYLPTQAVADFLSEVKEPAEIDGIIFRSVQSDVEGFNVVLFRKSSKVTPLDLTEGTEIDAMIGHMTEDGYEPDYAVFVQVPQEPPAAPYEWPPFKGLLGLGLGKNSGDLRPNSLSVDLDHLSVFHVRAAEYSCDSFKVTRYQSLSNSSSRASPAGRSLKDGSKAVAEHNGKPGT